MELHFAGGVMRQTVADSILVRYLQRLQHRGSPSAVATDEATAMLDAAARQEQAAILQATREHAASTGDERLVALHAVLAGDSVNPDNPAQGSLWCRLQLAFGSAVPVQLRARVQTPLKPIPSPAASPPTGATQPPSISPGLQQLRAARRLFAPPLRRSSMTPIPWGPLNPLRRWFASRLRQPRDWVERDNDPARGAWPAGLKLPGTPDTAVTRHQERWAHLGSLRRLTLLCLMLIQSAVATHFMRTVLPYQGSAPLEIVLLALFAILFCWVSAGFWTAMAGFLVLLRGNDRFAVTARLRNTTPLPASARTAIVMPICNEDAPRVMAGLRATYESVARTGELAQFDFFILSDSSESEVRTAELALWSDLCQAVDGFGRIFYRHRKRRVKRKSGNLDDFCRRWGSQYTYMIVLDADSVMSGECVTNLVRLMEVHPRAGIIQTAPVAAGRDTLYSRIQQFSSRLYGPLFTAGLHYWQLGESHYWGHNAIIRMGPFIEHCALSALPGHGSLAGEILSHDFVEAALMRRAGWAVWIAYDLEGSYEEMPSSLLEELKRDRRWCHGNLMNFRLFTARGMHRVHRAVFATGVMAYLSAPLWFGFLVVSTGLLAQQALTDPQYFVQPRQLFPIWPQWHPEKAIALFSATATLLFLPKVLSVLLVCRDGARTYGGVPRVVGGMLLEMLFSMLLAPVRMLFHTRFVAAAFLGWALHWRSPPRGDAQTGWREALGKHGGDMLLGVAWAAGVAVLNPAFLPWLLPIAAGLILSAPISVWSSQVRLGQRSRRARLFVIPEELAPPIELIATARHQEAMPPVPDFSQAVVDPVLNALASAAGRNGVGRRWPAAVTQGVAEEGPAFLSEAQKTILLNDGALLSRLHLEVWSSSNLLERWDRTIMSGQPEARTLTDTDGAADLEHRVR